MPPHAARAIDATTKLMCWLPSSRGFQLAGKRAEARKTQRACISGPAGSAEAARGELDPGRDDVRVTRRNDTLCRQPVQAGAYRTFRQPGLADQRGYRRERVRAVGPGVVGQADEHLHALDGCPPRSAGTGARFSAQEVASTLTGHPLATVRHGG
jgi:hypothetical protein